jgi:hypothetical protein
LEILVYFGRCGPFLRRLTVINNRRLVTTSLTRKSFLTRAAAFAACFGLGSKLTARAAALPAAKKAVGEPLPITVKPEGRAVPRRATTF